jgi:hypothetical protein
MREGSTPKSTPRVTVCGAASAIDPQLSVATVCFGALNWTRISGRGLRSETYGRPAS